MRSGISEIEKLLPGHLSGDLADDDRAKIDKWRKVSKENEALYCEYLKAWEAIPLLNEMEQFNSFEALKKVNARLHSGSSGWIGIIQKIAAIILLPVLVYSGYLTVQKISDKKINKEHVIMQTVTSRQGMVTNFLLADSTRVWLNAGSELYFPSLFDKDSRDVELRGEAFFQVSKNEKQPFCVNTKDLKIDALGTSFNVISYNDEKQSEVILVEGKVRLSEGTGYDEKEIGIIHPGQRAIFKGELGKIIIEDVEVDKYIAWRDGNLIFRDDQMDDVIRRLSRWFNVKIIVSDPEIKSYVYTATFRDENLEQVLKLLKLSAPIDYRIIESKQLPGNEFTKRKIYLMKKKI